MWGWRAAHDVRSPPSSMHSSTSSNNSPHQKPQAGPGGGAGCGRVRPAVWGELMALLFLASPDSSLAPSAGSAATRLAQLLPSHRPGAASLCLLPSHRTQPSGPPLPSLTATPQVRAGGKKSVAKQREIRNRESYIPSTEPYTVAGGEQGRQCVSQVCLGARPSHAGSSWLGVARQPCTAPCARPFTPAAAPAPPSLPNRVPPRPARLLSSVSQHNTVRV